MDASVVVWIVSNVREEHASAIQWLNTHTTDEVSFFLIEVHAYTIGNSAPAPMFKIIEQPNDFVKQVKNIAKSQTLSEAQRKRLEFWNQFNDILDSRGKPFNKRKATTDHWYSVAIGSSQCHISIDLVNREHKIRVSLWIPDNKELFDMLYTHREEIQRTAGIPLAWDRLEAKKASLICSDIKGLNFNDSSNYEMLINKAIDYVLKLRSAIVPYL